MTRARTGRSGGILSPGYMKFGKDGILSGLEKRRKGKRLVVNTKKKMSWEVGVEIVVGVARKYTFDCRQHI
jgi:hypothetical protein